MNRDIRPSNYGAANYISNSNYSMGKAPLTSAQVMHRPGYIPNPNSNPPRLPAGVIPYNNFFLTAVTAGSLPPGVRAPGNLAPNPHPSHAANVTAIRPPQPNTHQVNNNANNVVRLAPPNVPPAPTPSLPLRLLKPNKAMQSKQTTLNPNMVCAKDLAIYAMAIAKGPTSSLAQQFLPVRRVDAETAIVKAINTDLCARDALGIYSESPFLRPVALLRPVKFAAPSSLLYQYPDPDNMIRTLRDLADQKVSSVPLMAVISGSKPNALTLGFHTDYMIHVFNIELDLNLIGFLNEQAKSTNNRLDKYRVVLRLAWATQGLYVPKSPHNSNRALAAEVLPRCLAVRVARRNVPLPDPIFHGGQATKLGHRLRFSIDITDKIPIRATNLVRTRNVEIELTWLHAPLEDHAAPLLEVVGSGTCSPIMNHVINMPLVQVTLDRVQTIPQFVREFSTAVAGKPCDVGFPAMPSAADSVYGGYRLPKFTPDQLFGCYDFCASTERVISVPKTLEMLKKKISSQDDLLCDDWIPVTLLCPLTLTRIEVPVRSVNCDHLQCYDLASYLTINKQRPRWTCPVCSGPAPFRDLRRDDFFLQLLRDKSVGNAERLQVDADGHWRRAVDTASELENSSRLRQNGHDQRASGSEARRCEDAGGESASPSDSALLTPIKTDRQAAAAAAAPRSGGVDTSPCIIILDSDEDAEEDAATGVPDPAPIHSPPPPSFPPVTKPTAPPVSTSGVASQPTTLPSSSMSFFVDLTASSDEEESPPQPPAPPPPPPPPLIPVNPPPTAVPHRPPPQPSPKHQAPTPQRQILVIPTPQSTDAPPAVRQPSIAGLVPPNPNPAALDLQTRLIESLTSQSNRIVFLPTSQSLPATVTTPPTTAVVAQSLESTTTTPANPTSSGKRPTASSASASTHGSSGGRSASSSRFKVTAKRRCTASPPPPPPTTSAAAAAPSSSQSASARLPDSTEGVTPAPPPKSSTTAQSTERSKPSRSSRSRPRQPAAQSAASQRRKRVHTGEGEDGVSSTSDERMSTGSSPGASASDDEWMPSPSTRRQAPQTARRGGAVRRKW
uniref:SP-RING-type domain-containing protein n=1 Tax=Mesocestoides corti TaxID=53468 RepID=A0A5K3FBG5_MESCO